jgi:hypothetical protein
LLIGLSQIKKKARFCQKNQCAKDWELIGVVQVWKQGKRKKNKAKKALFIKRAFLALFCVIIVLF